jgi:hypothetical protein
MPERLKQYPEIFDHVYTVGSSSHRADNVKGHDAVPVHVAEVSGFSLQFGQFHSVLHCVSVQFGLILHGHLFTSPVHILSGSGSGGIGVGFGSGSIRGFG